MGKRSNNNNNRTKLVASALFVVTMAATGSDAFVPATSSSSSSSSSIAVPRILPQHLQLHMFGSSNNNSNSLDDDVPKVRPWSMDRATRAVATTLTTAAISVAFLFQGVAHAEDELAAKYGNGKGFDSSLVDQTCLVDKCSLQAKACLADDPSCRKGLTCTAKCMGDNACITGCMARYGNVHLDNLLKCTIEDHECIKVAILEGGADQFGEEPRAPAPTVRNFNVKSMEGSWYKVVGFNPNYDCYACQRNTFTVPDDSANAWNAFWKKGAGADVQSLAVDVEFSMPHLLPDGSPPPPKNQREVVSQQSDSGLMAGAKSIALNDYATHETMVFDTASSSNNLVMNKGTEQEASYSRTAHSEGEMFGLKFWENWYVLGENDPGQPEFKFIYYNGKTRQNTYNGAFVYSRQRELPEASMAKVYAIAQSAGMNPDQFCKIRNGCFQDETIVKEPETGLGSPSNPFRGILASTKVSQFFGVEPVAAENALVKRTSPVSPELNPEVLWMSSSNNKAATATTADRPWWYEVGDYLENPHRHFQTMDNLRIPMEWPEHILHQSDDQQPLN